MYLGYYGVDSLFADMALTAQLNAKGTGRFTLKKAPFYDHYKDRIDERQLKVINKMSDQGTGGGRRMDDRQEVHGHYQSLESNRDTRSATIVRAGSTGSGRGRPLPALSIDPALAVGTYKSLITISDARLTYPFIEGLSGFNKKALSAFRHIALSL